MEENRINERESLEIITAMIERTKERYMLGDGNIMLMWGYLTVAVSALVWILLAVTHHPAMNWLWFLIWIIGGTATPAMTKNRRMKKGARSYSDTIISRIWAAVGYCAIAFTLCCLGFLLCQGADTWRMMLAFALIIVPFAEIASGVVIRERTYVWGGAAGILTGIFTMCCVISGIDLSASWFIPLFMTTFICMMIIPGHIVNYKATKNR